MKKLYFFLILASLQSVVWAQDAKIAAVLAQMPANNAAALKKNISSVADLGEDGYVTLISGLTAPGKGNNAAIEYTVGGFTAYVTQTGSENLRKMSVDAYIKALQKLTDKQNKQFIISQFDLVGRDDAVPTLKEYLTDNDLADAASRALVKINSPASKTALLAALPKADGAAKLSVIEALGNIRYKAATKQINALAKTADGPLAKVSYYALALIADPSSATVLATAAAKSGYKYENTNATKSYLIYTEQLLKDGNKLESQKIANSLIAKTKGDDLVNVRIQALKILADASANKQTLLLTAATDANPQYRAAALRFALPYVNAKTVSLWTKKLAVANDDVKVDILYMLGQTSAKTALPAVLAQGKSKSPQVRLAAVNAAVNIGQEQVLGALIKLMNNSESDDIDNIVEAINHMKGLTVTQQVAAAVPSAKQSAQVALISILDTRAASDQFNTVFAQLKSANAHSRQAAFSALRRVSSKQNLPKLFTLLNETNDDEQDAVQDAIIAVVTTADDKPQQTDAVLQHMANASEIKKAAYYKILARLGNDKALKVVTDAYNSGNINTKKAAVNAFSVWANSGITHQLIKIAHETKDAELSGMAVTGYLNVVDQNTYTPEQHLLLLREAMAVTQDVDQKKRILGSVEQAKCFNSIVFAGKYLEDADLKQIAANSLVKVTLAGEYNGDMIKDLLNKAKPLVNNRQKDAIDKYITAMKPGEGFVSMFNGTDLAGWKGLVADPIKRAKMDAKTLAAAQEKADAEAKVDWKPVNGELLFEGKGFQNLCTVKKYGDFEMYVDWKIIDDHKGQGDAGIYLRGSPQVQIWDTTRHSAGAQVGSGGLYNNQVNESKPLKVADNKLDEWNTFHIIMKGDRVTVYLNGQLVTDNVILENYWDRKQPIFPIEQIELQAHGSPVAYRDLYIKELPQVNPFVLSDEEKKDGFKVLFDGTNMFNWIGNTVDYTTDDGNLVIHPRPGKGNGGNLYTKEEFSDFVFRFEFKLTPGANNGLGIRAPLEGDAAYTGMELQILDNEAPQYKNLHVYQYHGSVYGTIPAKRGFLKPVGEWNYEEVIVKGPKIKVILNGTVINDADITEARKNGAADGKPHPGLQRDSGHIGFLGHGDVVYFRNIRVKDLSKEK
ncbi:DUF1080 domain-containing protein [Mucilaginibacter panaciglaebae]|uniref:3-keto-alpha-glucoside-1,2-lyase/3-keto-2-hydroxy-glucal hydratase domain-containing protein n=1 Tax=Mucilaginibacter panaciglaebae TaxID=502331 RepID=A0ABP7W9Z8_9SPHI